MQFRDLTLIRLDEEEDLVIACDICAGIGEKEHDVLHVSPELVGSFSARVVLMELLAFGATPFSLVVLVGNEINDTAKRVMCGVKDELVKAGYPHLAVNGSTEDNMKPLVTSVGITALGRKKRQENRSNLISCGDKIYRVGRPLVGKDVLLYNDTLLTYEMMNSLRLSKVVYDILPIGSKGTTYEACILAETNGFSLDFVDGWKREPTACTSGGPATSALVVVDGAKINIFEKEFPRALLIGVLRE